MLKIREVSDRLYEVTWGKYIESNIRLRLSKVWVIYYFSKWAIRRQNKWIDKNEFKIF